MTDAAAPSRNYWRIAGVTLTFIWFFVGGIGHFVITKTFTSVVPPYIPFPREMVYLTGVCEIAGALALLYKPLRSIAGIMLALLAICVTPVHIQMLIEADKYAALGPPHSLGPPHPPAIRHLDLLVVDTRRPRNHRPSEGLVSTRTSFHICRQRRSSGDGRRL